MKWYKLSDCRIYYNHLRLTNRKMTSPNRLVRTFPKRRTMRNALRRAVEPKASSDCLVSDISENTFK